MLYHLAEGLKIDLKISSAHNFFQGMLIVVIGASSTEYCINLSSIIKRLDEEVETLTSVIQKGRHFSWF